MKINKKSGFAYLPIILIIIILAAIGTGGYLYTKNQNQQTQKVTPIPVTTPDNSFKTLPVVTTADETKDWKTYKNEKYGFELKYPPQSYALSDNLSQPASPYLAIYPIPSPIEFGPQIELSVNSSEQSVTDLSSYLLKYYNKHSQFNWVRTNASINGQSGFKVETKGEDTGGPAFNYTNYYFLNRGMVYKINYNSTSSQQDKTFEDIISTFKFTK